MNDDAKRHAGDTDAVQDAGELRRSGRVLFWLLTVGFAVAACWAALGELDVVSVAEGRVAPASKVKRVDHLEGGIVREVLVREGEAVDAGELLVVLDETLQGATRNEVAVRVASLQAEEARLVAEAAGAEGLAFPAGFVDAHPQLAAEAEGLFEQRRSRLASQLAEQDEAVVQIEQEIAGVEARVKNTRHALGLINKELAISRRLLEEQLATELDHIKLRREATALQSRIEEDAAALARAQAALKEAQAKRKRLEQEFREDASEALARVRRERQEALQRLDRVTDALARTEIRSPTAGVVKAVSVVNIGEVVSPGQTIMEIVPTSDALVVEARLPMADIGYVMVGQPARIRLATRDSVRFGHLEGRVVSISPDAFVSEDGGVFYTVRIETEAAAFEREGAAYQLYPGMVVATAIRTGERTVLEYLLEPFTNAMALALQER